MRNEEDITPFEANYVTGLKTSVNMEKFQEIMNDMFRQFSAQQIYRVMKNTWDFQKKRK